MKRTLLFRVGREGGTRILLALAVFLIGLATLRAESPAGKTARVQQLKITILSTMLADGRELGEWGFSALVVADGHQILFDTGAHPDVVLENARSLGIDLTTVPEVVLSHCHADHVGGLVALRNAVRAENPDALSRVHVGEGIFASRWSIMPRLEENPMIKIRPEYEKTGGIFISHDKPVQLYPGVWLTGPIPRKYPEHNWSRSDKIVTPQGSVEDTVPEDMALVFDTEQGLVVLFGCGHAGVINTLEYARTVVRPARIHAIIGGLHLFAASDETLSWTAAHLAALGVDNLLGAHCTGIEAVYRLRHDLNLDRQHAVVGAVGATFTLGEGINPRNIAR
jgi:7,8-dihydropterin-6-yl-methyl-4-(beta-D-ribofuranosyl)aminobenzene 5'-phosphate synthase